jgi:Papain-like cysteine protease AvrRpt2
MALIMQPPNPKWPPGHGHKYSVSDGDNWVDLARKDGWPDPWGLIQFNFGLDGSDRQLHSMYVNWYLKYHVGCVLETDDHKNYRFSDDAFPGIIYTKHKLSGGEVGDHLPFWVPRTVPVISQTGAWDCWWTVAAIMFSWRYGSRHTAREAVDKAEKNAEAKVATPPRPDDVSFRALYQKGKGLKLGRFREFARCCGMFPITSPFTSLGGWYTEMWRYRSPLAIVSRVVEGVYHGRVLHGITGDGGPTSRMHFANPGAGGIRETDTFDAFQGDYEREFLVTSHPLVMRWGHA